MLGDRMKPYVDYLGGKTNSGARHCGLWGSTYDSNLLTGVQ